MIKKAFGLLKRRFPALRHGLRFKKPEDSCILISAALVLHNILIDFRDPIDDFDALDNENLGFEQQELTYLFKVNYFYVFPNSRISLKLNL